MFVVGGLLMFLVGEVLSEMPLLSFLNCQLSMSYFIVPVAMAAALSLLIRTPAREISSGG